MKGSFCVLALIALTSVPAKAGVSVHLGGGYCGTGFRGGGYCAGYRSFAGNRGYAYYGRGFYGYAPFYTAPYNGYSYPIGYDSSSYYSGSVSPSSYPLPNPNATQPSAQAGNPAAAPEGPLPAGKVDEFGFIHSPFSTTTFKAASIANGQVFYDPTTGQPFIVHVMTPAPATLPSTPSATSLPKGKLDEFGYVHSPFSTFTFRVQNGNYAQTFRDPFTAQNFTVTAPQTPEAVASTKPRK